MGVGDERLKIITGQMPLAQAARALKKSKQEKGTVSLRGKKGREFLRQRVVYTKSYVYLGKIKDAGVAVSIWEVMRKAGARKPWERSGDVDLMIEAAVKLGMRIVKEKNTILFK